MYQHTNTCDFHPFTSSRYPVYNNHREDGVGPKFYFCSALLGLVSNQLTTRAFTAMLSRIQDQLGRLATSGLLSLE